jgi:SRSO17 transposase
VRHRAKWQLALDILDELLGWSLERHVVQADGGYGDITAFRLGLEQRALEYVVQVKATTSAQPADAVPVTSPYPGRGRPRAARYPDAPSNLGELILVARQSAGRPAGRLDHRLQQPVSG